MIFLRPLALEDIDDFLIWATDPEVTRYTRWAPYQSRKAAEEFFERIVKQHPWFQAILVGENVIGSLTLDLGKGDYQCKAVLGYVSAKKYWGKGFMTEAVSLAVERGFQELGVARIEAFVSPLNIGSQRVLEKNGFVHEGIMKKAIVRQGNLEDLFLYARVK
ncbi:MAG: GNAT family N-acetyltransferase [Chthoniobacterales bacterium]|nr:GNAT family N-acetyltransferase [Chthoniobacterales bacterium]